MKRKAEEVAEEESMYNHGVKWLRGPLISEGGFGSVYLANLKKPKSRSSCFPPVMAVKSAEFSVSGSLQREKVVFDQLNACPCIIRCYGDETTLDKNGNMVYNLLLEYASGGTLAALIKKSNNGCGLTEMDVRKYTRSILRGIDYIHSNGYVHCDLKPENILLVSVESAGSSDCKFVPKIGDFGLAKKSDNRKKKKFDPFFGGTALYMAPESVVDHIQEPPSDIWALGCIILEMLTGKPAWNLKPEATTEELLQKIGDGLQLPKIPDGISKEAKEFLKRCLVRNTMYRLTAEMLLEHPFVSRLDREEFEDWRAVSNAGRVDASVSLSDANGEFWALCSSEDCSVVSEESSSFSSYSDDIEESDSPISSTINSSHVITVKASPEAPSNTMQQHQPMGTIPAGA